MPSGTKPPTDAFNHAVMTIIRARMEELGHTTADLSRMTEIPPSTLSDIIRSRKQPGIMHVRQIAIALKLNMSALMAAAEDSLAG